MSTSTSPQPPLSSSQSPITSLYTSPTSLEALVSHLLAAKRSLSSINNVWRANEIVTSARAALEESVVLNARTSFLQSGIQEEVVLLRKVRGGIEGVYKDGQREFTVSLIWMDVDMKDSMAGTRFYHADVLFM